MIKISDMVGEEGKLKRRTADLALYSYHSLVAGSRFRRSTSFAAHRAGRIDLNGRIFPLKGGFKLAARRFSSNTLTPTDKHSNGRESVR